MITRRRILIASSLGVLSSARTFAQDRAKVTRIGFLGATSASGLGSRLEAFRMGLRDLGYVEGRNITFEYRWADSSYGRLPKLAAELVQNRVDIIVTYGTPGTLAAKNATTTIPIVMIVSGDAIATGVINNLARPNANITGSTFFVPELMAKRLELLKELIPRIRNVGVLLNRSNHLNGPMLSAMESVANSLDVRLGSFEIRGPQDIDATFLAITKSHMDAIVFNEDGMLVSNARTISDAAAKERLPSSGPKDFVEVGSIVGYGVKILELWRRAPYFLDRIVKGAKPRDLPVEQATTFELVLNLNTALRLGIAVPRSLLLRADEVIN